MFCIDGDDSKLKFDRKLVRVRQHKINFLILIPARVSQTVFYFFNWEKKFGKKRARDTKIWKPLMVDWHVDYRLILVMFCYHKNTNVFMH